MIRAMVELSTVCNQSCPSCINPIMERPRITMEPAVITRTIDGFVGARDDFKLWLHLFGEPLTNPFVIQAVRHAKNLGLPFVGLSTNGILLNAQIASSLLGAGIDRIEVSIDSFDEGEYRVMRGVDTLAPVIENLRGLIAKKQASNATTEIVINAMVEGEAARKRFIDEVDRLGLDADAILFITPAHLRGGDDTGNVARSCDHRSCGFAGQSVVVLVDGSVVPCYLATSDVHMLGHASHESVSTIHERFVATGTLERFIESVCRDCPESTVAGRYTFRNV